MKACVTIVIFFHFSLTLPGQILPADFHKIDRDVISVDALTPDTLSARLTSPYRTDIEKVRAIFSWIARKIKYKMKNGVPVTAVIPLGYDPWYTDSSLNGKPAYETIAERVLQKRVAVCDGYARLFKTLCDYAGIRSEIISGYARNNFLRSHRVFRTNHTWNAVYINGQWQLLDVTWAAGYVTFYDEEFVQQFNDRYFLTPPEEFILDHMPEDIRWTLLTDPPGLPEYEKSPYMQKSFTKYRIEYYSPSNGLIKARPGDTIHFEIQTRYAVNEKNIASDPFIDSTLFDHSPRSVFLYPEFKKEGRLASYTYIVPAGDVEWITLVYNRDLVLRYQLKLQMNGTD